MGTGLEYRANLCVKPSCRKVDYLQRPMPAPPPPLGKCRNSAVTRAKDAHLRIGDSLPNPWVSHAEIPQADVHIYVFYSLYLRPEILVGRTACACRTPDPAWIEMLCGAGWPLTLNELLLTQCTHSNVSNGMVISACMTSL